MEIQKIRIFRTLKLLSMCHRSSLNCLLCQYSLSKHTTFVCALPPRDVFRRSKRPCRHCPGSLCCLNPFGTCLEFLLNIRADHPTTVCVLQQPYNQQSPCSATHCGSRGLISVVPSNAGWSYQTRPSSEDEKSASKAHFW